MHAMRIVLDTNVLIAALIGSGGASRTLLRACLRGEFEPQMGNALFAEYESVTRRPPIVEQCALTPDQVEQILDAFLSRCRWVEVYYLWRPNLPDEADHHVLELAVASGASAIVTHNQRDFRRSELIFDRIRVVAPGAFLEEEES